MYRSFYIVLSLWFLFSGCSKDEIKEQEEDINSEDKVSDLIDGPYIFHENEGLKGYFVNTKGELVSGSVSFDDEIKVYTPYREPDEFEFTLKKELLKTETVFDDGHKIFAVSDIEGNYYALTKLLIGNGIVDKDLNWTFGENHLVFNGDMVDRGKHVTQVLWLMYKLDYQAQNAGGYVHFILGNHDVMCMAGDSRYAHDKYLDVAEKLNIEYKELYGENSEIGRWMRSKNAIEKINGYIFVHAGISSDVLETGLSFSEINESMRPYYGKRIDNSVPDDVYKLFKTSGVLWFRGYVKRREGAYEKATIDDVNNTLNFYNAKSIVVGHCLMDEICVKYGGKVVTMDVHHPESKSSDIAFQALLIENDKLYRIDEKGEKVSLN